MLNHVTWSPLAQFLHAATISGPPSVVAYSEVEEETGRRILAVSECLAECLAECMERLQWSAWVEGSSRTSAAWEQQWREQEEPS